ncbi:MAG: class I adenylate-forming enzyme family protein [Aquisalimonadaceae bacterium]
MNRPNSLVHGLLDHAADAFPENIAIETGDQAITYSQLRSISADYAHWMRLHGIKAGSRVVLAAENSVATVAMLFGALALRAGVCPIHPSAPAKQRTYIAGDADAQAVICRQDGGLMADTPVGALPVPDFVAAKGLNSVYDSLQSFSPGAISEDLACLIYTSGSTGRPKGVTCLHRQVRFAVTAIAESLDYRPEDKIFVALPLSFDYGLYQVFLGLQIGATVYLADPISAGPTMIKELITTQATVLPAVAPMLDNLVVLAKRKVNELAGLRLITTTGAAVPPATVDALRRTLPNLSFQLMYGLTECKRATINPPDADLGRPGSCGLPLPGTTVFVIDDDGNRVADGTVGQIVVRGENVMAGYWNNQEQTAKCYLTRNATMRELRTGDYGWIDPEGFLFFSGRRDDIFKQRGFRVSCSEIEAAACALDGVTCAVLVPPEGKRQSVLFVTFEHDEFDVIARLQEALEDYKIPGKCLGLGDMPITRNGKFDRKQLKAMAHA